MSSAKQKPYCLRLIMLTHMLQIHHWMPDLPYCNNHNSYDNYKPVPILYEVIIPETPVTAEILNRACHQSHNCLLNRLCRRRSKKTSKLRVTGLCVGNWPETGEFPTHMASNVEPGGRLNKKDGLTRYGNSHVKDKTSKRPSDLQHGNRHTYIRRSLYWDGAQAVSIWWRHHAPWHYWDWYPSALSLSEVKDQAPLDLQSSNKSMHKPGPWFNIKMPFYQYRKSQCGDKTVVKSSYLHNGISYCGKMTSLYWIRVLTPCQGTRTAATATAARGHFYLY